MSAFKQTEIYSLAGEVGKWLSQHEYKLVTIESCTGGGIAQAITSIAGSSGWFDRGLVTYTNQAKHDMAGVPLKLIHDHGAVSIEVAKAMAIGGLNNSEADIGVSVTGIAGPDGGSASKPVGTVCFAWALKSIGETTISDSQNHVFKGDREQVRARSVAHALQTILTLKEPLIKT
ncbi:MAG: CinA family protein [bacterium]